MVQTEYGAQCSATTKVSDVKLGDGATLYWFLGHNDGLDVSVIGWAT